MREKPQLFKSLFSTGVKYVINPSLLEVTQAIEMAAISL